MRLLLDTHVFLWWRENSPSLQADARRAITEAEIVFVSAASAWEAAIKVALGKLHIPGPFEQGVEDSQFSELPVHFRHTAAVAHLPRHHSDPFDRMLIAQAQAEGLMIVTHNRHFERYPVSILWT